MEPASSRLQAAAWRRRRGSAADAPIRDERVDRRLEARQHLLKLLNIAVRLLEPAIILVHRKRDLRQHFAERAEHFLDARRRKRRSRCGARQVGIKCEKVDKLVICYKPRRANEAAKKSLELSSALLGNVAAFFAVVNDAKRYRTQTSSMFPRYLN